MYVKNVGIDNVRKDRHFVRLFEKVLIHSNSKYSAPIILLDSMSARLFNSVSGLNMIIIQTRFSLKS